MTIKKPTVQFYEELQFVYDTFNARLFNNELPDCLITLQRMPKTSGYWSENRFASLEDGQMFTHELALNPDYFGIQTLLEIFSTLVHEQIHLKQFLYGKPSKRSYHNSEFALFMREVGLIPSHTGRPKGRETGEKMSDYPDPDGLFIQVCNDLVDDGRIIKWYDKYALKTVSSVEMLKEQIEMMDLVPNASPKLFHIPHLGPELSLAYKVHKQSQTNKDTSVTAAVNEPVAITGYGIPNQAEDEPSNPFDIAIASTDTSEEHIATLGGIIPAAFTIEPIEESNTDFCNELAPLNEKVDHEENVVRIFKGESNNPDQEVVVIKEVIVGNTKIQEVAPLDYSPPEPKKQTRESFVCPGCGRTALCSPTFSLTCTDCVMVLVLSKSIDKDAIKAIKQNKKKEGVSSEIN